MEMREDQGSLLEHYLANTDLSSIPIKKKQVLQTPGSISSKAYYVKRGLLRSYLIDANGKVHIYIFAPEGWLISDNASQAMGLTSELYIDALEDSEIYEIEKGMLDSLVVEVQDVQEMQEINKKLLRRIAVLQKRVDDANERFRHGAI